MKVQMNRKQQIALVLMALYFIANVQANIDRIFLGDDEILYRLLNVDLVNVDPDLEGLDPDTLKVLSSHISSYVRGPRLQAA